MELETKNKKINLVLRTRKLADISNKLKGKNFEDVFFKAMSEYNYNSLSKIIYLLAEDEDKKSSFTNSDEVYDFIDDYMIENKKTYKEVFEQIAEEINKAGFFNTKMTTKQLKSKMDNPLSGMNLDDIIKNSAEKAISKMAVEEFTGNQFQGYKA